MHLKSVVNNPDMRRESIAEIKKIAEGIVQKGEGRGLLCSVDSGNVNLNGNDLKSSIDESQPSPVQQHTSVIITNPSVDLATGGSPASNGTTGEFNDLILLLSSKYTQSCVYDITYLLNMIWLLIY